MIPGETYIQCILNQLNGVEVKGQENLTRMLNAIALLERLKKDVTDHKNKEEKPA